MQQISRGCTWLTRFGRGRCWVGGICHPLCLFGSNTGRLIIPPFAGAMVSLCLALGSLFGMYPFGRRLRSWGRCAGVGLFRFWHLGEQGGSGWRSHTHSFRSSANLVCFCSGYGLFKTSVYLTQTSWFSVSGRGRHCTSTGWLFGIWLGNPNLRDYVSKKPRKKQHI